MPLSVPLHTSSTSVQQTPRICVQAALGPESVMNQTVLSLHCVVSV